MEWLCLREVFVLALMLGIAVVSHAEQGYYGGGSSSGGRGKYEYNSDQLQNYRMLPKVKATGQERALCFGKYSPCQMRILRCPLQCPQRLPPQSNGKAKGAKRKACMVDCLKCEATCKDRKPKCEGFGAICYDPRFVGGDGVLFYFHGARDKDFALVTDKHIQINAHFIGTRPDGRKRDYTWVQALGFLLPGGATFTVEAEHTAKWDDAVDRLRFTYGGAPLPVGADAWTSPSGVITVERTDDTNAAAIWIKSVGKITVRAVPVDEKDNKVHNYQIPAGDAFAHLEMQFNFNDDGLSESVDGVLGQTYRPGFVNPVKKGVPMPVMGGEDRFGIASLLSAECAQCVFKGDLREEVSVSSVSPSVEKLEARCGSGGGGGGGFVCRR